MKSRSFILLSGAVVALLGLVIFLHFQPVKILGSLRSPNPILSKQKELGKPIAELPDPLANEPVKENHVPPPPVLESQPDYEVSTAATGIHDGDLVVPLGARVPAVLMDAGSPGDGVQVPEIMSNLVEDFREKILEAKRTNRNMTEAWEEARMEADERYRFFFGQDAFNAATLETASEAVEETTPSTGN
jgi:hypothetical protein